MTIVFKEDDLSLWALTGAVRNAASTAAPDPDGSDADQLIDNNAGGTGTVRAKRGANPVNLGIEHCFSVFIKADGLDWVRLFQEFNTDGACSTYVDITNKTLNSVLNIDSSGIETYSDGWIRPWYTFTQAVDTAFNSVIAPANGDGAQIVDLDNTSSIFVWGALLEEASSPSAYFDSGNRNFIAVTRRKSDQMIVRPRMPKPRNTLRGRFE